MIGEKSYMGIWGAVKLILLSLFIEISMMFAITFFLAKFGINTDSPFLDLLPSFGALILVLKTAYDKYGINVMSNFSNSSRDLSLMIPMILTVLGLNIFVGQILNYVDFYFPMSEFWIEAFENAFGEEANYIGALVTTIVVAPIAEEVLLRGIILKGLLSRYSAPTSILISSLLFGAIHGNLYQFVLALIVGVFLGWMFVKTRSLLLCILAHAFFNSLGFISADLLKLKIPGYTLEGFQPIWFTSLGILFTAVGIVILIKKTSHLTPMNAKTYGEFY